MTQVTGVDRLASPPTTGKTRKNGMRILRMRLLNKISLSMAALVLLAIAGVCGWLIRWAEPELYRGLKRYGVETELVVYPREPHGFHERSIWWIGCIGFWRGMTSI
jgi:hypothetical protein